MTHQVLEMAQYRRRAFALAIGFVGLVGAGAARAEVPITRTVRFLPVSNGFGAVVLDLDSRRVTHFREHLFATEEPRLNEHGKELWQDGKPQDVPTRDLLYDAYFGLRVGSVQGWLTNDPVVAADSGYAAYEVGWRGGTSVASMRQTRGNLQLTTHVFAPADLERAAWVMILQIRNAGASPSSPITAFSLHNFHLGFGRPGVSHEIGEQAETVVFDDGQGKADFIERGFAGTIVSRPLATPSRHAASHAGSPADVSVFPIVNNPNGGNLPNHDGMSATADGWVTAYQLDVGAIGPGETRSVGVMFAHHGNPFADAAVQAQLTSYRRGRSAEQLLEAEIARDASFQTTLVMPRALSVEDETLYRQSAIMLRMAQVRERRSYLRPWFSQDGEPRRTRFGKRLGDPAATLPAEVAHRGYGAVIASLPPGEWTVPWIRDGAYAVAAMAASGMHKEARAALSFYLEAEAGRFRDWQELSDYGMPPYQISLVRYYGFGVEETDFNAFGPNLEFDGFGLFLWALRRYEEHSGDTSLREEHWPAISERVADVIVALIQDDTGLMAPDSSIWESHWNGRQRHWGYTNITAVRGLCDASVLAERHGDLSRAQSYLESAEQLRAAIANQLTDAKGGLASNLEELRAGAGYWDAAVVDAIAMGLFDPRGRVATATMAGLDQALRVPAGAGWARNDDRFDHSGSEDLSPWGSEYDSGEWVITDLRGAVAASRGGDTMRAARLRNWVRDQALANYLEVAEVFDEGKGTYKFNAPMMGFGAGAFILALHASETASDPACGAYMVEAGPASSASSSSSSGDVPSDPSSCACRTVRPRPATPWSLGGGLFLFGLFWRRRGQLIGDRVDQSFGRADGGRDVDVDA